MISMNTKNQISSSDLPNGLRGSLLPRAQAPLHSRRSPSMCNTYKKAARLISLPVIALLLASPTCLTFIEIAEAGSINPDSRREKVSPLVKGNNHRADEIVTVILALNGSPSGRLNALLAQSGVHVRRQMKALGTMSVTVPYGMVDELASLPEVAHISANQVVRTMGHVSATSGVDAGQAAASAAGRGTIDGAGVGVAILDSGIDVNHAQFLTSGGSSRVVASVDFTGENRTDDPFGHGTFVAAAAAGGAGAGADHQGIAAGVSLMNVRVL